MNLSKRMAHYLKGNIDFSSFYIVDVIPQNKHNAVILLAPTIKEKYSHFNLQYKDRSLYYGTIEGMMEQCITCGYISRLRANIRILQYHRKSRKQNKLK